MPTKWQYIVVGQVQARSREPVRMHADNSSSSGTKLTSTRSQCNTCTSWTCFQSMSLYKLCMVRASLSFFTTRSKWFLRSNAPSAQSSTSMAVAAVPMMSSSSWTSVRSHLMLYCCTLSRMIWKRGSHLEIPSATCSLSCCRLESVNEFKRSRVVESDTQTKMAEDALLVNMSLRSKQPDSKVECKVTSCEMIPRQHKCTHCPNLDLRRLVNSYECFRIEYHTRGCDLLTLILMRPFFRGAAMHSVRYQARGAHFWYFAARLGMLNLPRSSPWKTTLRKAPSNLNSFWTTTRILWALSKLLLLGSWRRGCVDKIEGEPNVEFSGLNEAISIDLSKCKLSGGDRWGDWDQCVGIKLKDHQLVLYGCFNGAGVLGTSLLGPCLSSTGVLPLSVSMVRSRVTSTYFFDERCVW